MAEYEGILSTDERVVEREWRCTTASYVHTTEKPHTGSYSVKLWPGDVYFPVWYGCDAGSKTITIWVYPYSVGTCQMRVTDPDTGATMGEALNVGSLAWEQLSVTFTAEKKVYQVIFGNYDNAGYFPYVRRPTWWDDLE